MNLVPLFEEALEFQNYNGTVLSNGKVAVYYIGRTRLADIYNDVAAEYPAENPRILDNLGMGPIYVNPAFDYELVVFDAYDNELFSVKKYLHSKGEHSTANVVVTPSENIAVSAWTVGDVQVYMPYLTGDVGKTYEGVDPIVVNNVEDKISANHVPLGVQEPLYFVQDDEEGCILGCSGDTEPYVNHDRTIKIDNHVVSTDMQAVMIRQQINNSSTDYKYAKICEADLNTVTWINEWMTTLQLNFQSCGAYYEGKSFGTFVLNCENYVQSSQTYVQKHEEDGKWVIFAKDDHSPQIVKLYLYWRDDSSSQHYELWGEFANLKYYEAVGVAAILNCSLRNHLTSSLPIDQERNIWRFNPIGIETLKNALPTGMNLVGQYLPDDASIKPVSDDSAGTFYATYTYGGPDSGNTPYEDIKAAYDAGKAIFVKFKESSASTETEIFSLVGFWELPNRPDLNRFQFQNLDQWFGKTIYRFPSNWGKMSDHSFALQDNLWDLTQSIAPDDFLVPIPSPSGVYCTRNYQVYKALEPITSNTWVESAWTPINVMDEIYNLQNKEENHDIFVAEYPTTDASAVQSALSAGKYVVTKLANDFIPVVYTDEYRAIFCGLVGGNSGGAGGYSIDVDFSTGWSDPISIPFATYPGVQGMISAATSGALSSVYQPYAGAGTTGNLVFSAERYPKQVRTCISGTDATVTAGVLPPVPEQNSTSTQILVAASGSLADVEWREFDVSALTGKLDNSASANFYPMTGNPSGFLTAAPDPVTIAYQNGDTMDTDYDGLKVVKSTATNNEHINLHKKSTDQWLIHGGLVPTSPGSNKFLITDDSGSMHWENNSGLARNSGFEIVDSVITAYNGTAFSGIGEQIVTSTASGEYYDYRFQPGYHTAISGINDSALMAQWSRFGDYAVYDISGRQLTGLASETYVDSNTSGKQDKLSYGYNDTSISAIDTSALYDNSAHARIGTLSTRISNLDSNKQDKLTFHYVEI